MLAVFLITSSFIFCSSSPGSLLSSRLVSTVPIPGSLLFLMLQHPDPFSGAVLDVLIPGLCKMLGAHFSPCRVSGLVLLRVPFTALIAIISSPPGFSACPHFSPPKSIFASSCRFLFDMMFTCMPSLCPNFLLFRSHLIRYSLQIFLHQ